MIKNKSKNKPTRYGINATATSSSRTFAMVAEVKNATPTGGVTEPIKNPTMTTTAAWTSGNPALAITSTKTGPTIIIFTAESITVPRRKIKRISASMKIIGEPVRLSSQFSRSLIAPSDVSSQLNGPDAAIMIKTIAELRNARRKAPEHSFHLIVL